MHKSNIRTSSHEELLKRKQINVSSGRIGERLVIRTTTVTGQGLRYTLTRPLQSPESHGSDNAVIKKHKKSSSDGAFEICASQDEAISDLLRSLSMDYCAGNYNKAFRTFGDEYEDMNEIWKCSSGNVSSKTDDTHAKRRRSFLESFQNEKLHDFHIESSPNLKTSSLHLVPLKSPSTSDSKPSTSQLTSFKLPTLCKNCQGISLARGNAKQYRSSDSLSSDIDYDPKRKTKAVQTPATYLLKRRSLSYQRAKQQSMPPNDGKNFLLFSSKNALYLFFEIEVYKIFLEKALLFSYHLISSISLINSVISAMVT